MSQEYTEDKEVSLQPLSSGRRLLEALLIIVALFAVYLMVALVSFNPSDPSWSQTAWHEPIHNWGGGVGAWLADTLFFIFGVMAYAIPPVILGLCWISFRQRHAHEHIDFFALALRLIGVLALVVTSCGLAALNADDIWYFSSGGVIGSLLSNAMDPWVDAPVGTLILLCVWAAGLTLYTGWSWLTIAEKIGSVVMGALTFASNRSRADDEWQETEAEYAEDEEPALSAAVADADDVLLGNTHFSAVDDDEYDPLLATSAQPASMNAAAVQGAAGPQPAKTPASSAVAPEVVTTPVQSTVTESVQPVGETPAVAPVQPMTEQSASSAMQQSPVVAPAQPSVAEHNPVTAQAESGNAQPPLYRFEMPQQEVQPAFVASAPIHDDDGPQMGNWQAVSAPEPGRPSVGHPVETAAAIAGVTATIAQTAMQATTVAPGATPVPQEHHNPQVKQGIGPELPRPKKIKLPTRRELASYGIKLPSQRLAEEKAKEEELRRQQQSQQQVNATSPYLSSEQEADAAAEEHLRNAFLAQQQQRYGDDFSQEEDEDALQQAELARQFAAQQQQRYAEPAPAPTFVLDTASVFDMSPMEDLVDDGPEEPLFTPSFAPADPVNDASQDAISPATPVNSNVQQPQSHSQWQQNIPQPPQSSVSHGNPQQAVTPAVATPSYTESAAAPSAATPVATPAAPEMDSLIHPFLMRHERPIQKPTTPLPSLELLAAPPSEVEPVDHFALEQTSRLIEARLADYRVKAEVVGYSPGPVITRFELDLAPGVKAARISNLSRDLARSLSAVAVRVVEVIPGKPYVGLELPNHKRQTVYLREVLDCPAFMDNPSPLSVVLGKDISGEPVVADLGKMPHLLVAGTTGSGKSVGVNAMILSILYKATPKDVRFIMIDPKMLELSVYEGIPHLLTDVVTDMKDAANALRWCVAEMERRYKLMSALGVRNIAGYNDLVERAVRETGRPIPDPLWKPGDSMDTTIPVLDKEPYIVVMVDEFADLIMTVGKKVEELIARLAQKARAAGIHLVLATQRPSVDVITGLIKANIPTRIAFTVSSKIDSRTILDQGGAESLLGMGDMLYLAPNSSIPTRVHGAFVRDQEVHAVVNDWKARERPQYKEGILSGGDDGESSGNGIEGDEDLDPLFDQAVAFVVDKRRASISGVQRQFRIGYNRAARIVEQMEAQGIVSPPAHNGNREVLAPPPHEM